MRELDAELYGWPADLQTPEEAKGGSTREQMQRTVDKGKKVVGEHPLNKAEVS